MAKSSISTMWTIGRFERAADFVDRISDIGFSRVELNHAITPRTVDEFRALQTAGKVQISSVHAPCPRWDRADGPLPEISALDNQVRDTAVGLVKRTIDLAVELGAEAVIVHSGRVEMDFELASKLRHLYEGGKLYSTEYQRAKSELVSARADARDKHLQATFNSIEEIAGYAARYGIQIGLENRYHYYEIPLPDELRMILDSLDGSTICYWHDFGHAHTLATLDLVSLDSWLPAFQRSTLGLHLHDAIGLLDHRAAGAGDVDFAVVKPWIPAEALRVCEFDQSMSEEDVRNGYNYLKQLGYF